VNLTSQSRKDIGYLLAASAAGTLNCRPICDCAESCCRRQRPWHFGCT